MRTTSTSPAPGPGGDGIRAAAPADFRALVGLHDRLEPLIVLSRHFTSHPDLSASHMADLLDNDGHDRVAFVSERQGRITGFGRYVRRLGTAAGDAVLLADAEGRGAGDEESLLVRLAETAVPEGLTHLVVEVLPIDREFLDLVDASSLPLGRHLHCGAVTVTLDLARFAEQADPEPESDPAAPAEGPVAVRS